jgi:di/tricarboxylate transporter
LFPKIHAMTNDQLLIILVLLASMGMFLWGKWRHDMVALGALLACVLLGLVPSTQAFSGFGHPAVITVACVLILSRGLQNSGAVDAITRVMLPKDAGPIISLTALVGVGALLSGFMNNVGAMALLMPVAIQLSGRLDLPPGRVLMPLAFGTILGGMTTLIGTPPNLIVSGFRTQYADTGFGMFDFAPVGVVVAVVGVAFLTIVGWRLVPIRKRSSIEDFETGAYLTEARVGEKSKAAGMTLRAVEEKMQESGAQIIALVRNDVRMRAPHGGRRIAIGDVLVMEADVDALPNILSSLELELEKEESGDGEDTETSDGASESTDNSNKEESDDEKEQDDTEKESSDDDVLMELAVRPESPLTGRSASELLLRTRYGINLLALSREGSRSRTRLRTLKIQPGDLLLMQGPPEALSEFATDNRCVPLAERDLRIPDTRKAITAGVIMAGAVAGAAFGLLPAAISFAIGVLASMALRTVPPRTVYDAVDWPIVVLLGALIPVAGAMASTGTADLIAKTLVVNLAGGNAIVVLGLILVVTMFLSDLMNNAATAAVMCPIAIGTAATLSVNPDTFLMAVAVGASCAFLTPIGHQNNTLILGPGGFKFGDYWRLGVPVELLVISISLPLLLVVWPLHG